MRFKTSIINISMLTKLISCLSSIGKVAWLKLDEDEIRFALLAEAGVQVFATLAQETVFDDYRISSASENIINLEVPLVVLLRALRSCASASDATLRLTKRASDNAPILCLTITTASAFSISSGNTMVTQEIPVRVLSGPSVAAIREPTCPVPDAQVTLPPLAHIRSITERFNKLSHKSFSHAGDGGEGPRLIISANKLGDFKMRLAGNDAVKVESLWKGLNSSGMNSGDISGNTGNPAGTAGPGPEAVFANVTVDGREWWKVLKVGGLARKVVACFAEEHALVLYVYLTEEEDDTALLTYYMSSYSS